jgi:hypothetical protein
MVELWSQPELGAGGSWSKQRFRELRKKETKIMRMNTLSDLQGSVSFQHKVNGCKIIDQERRTQSQDGERTSTSTTSGHKGSSRINRGPIQGRN